MKKAASVIVLMLLLTSMLSSAFIIQPVRAWTGTVYIRADGSIYPSDAPIQRDGNVYTLTGNITSSADGIVVERDNIVIDGAGYTLQGTENGTGIDLFGRTNVTVRNAQIKNFSYGIWLDSSRYISITGNTMTNNIISIWLFDDNYDNRIASNNIVNNDIGVYLKWYSKYNNISGNSVIDNRIGIYFCWTSDSNIVCGNKIIANRQHGIYLESDSNDIFDNEIVNNRDGVWLDGSDYNWINGNNIINNSLYGVMFWEGGVRNIFINNNFINNTKQVYFNWSPQENIWNSSYSNGGNFWSDYNGTDLSGDGFGDTAYVIDVNNQDGYPLMAPLVWDYSNPIPVVWAGQVYPVALSSNSTISAFKFNQPQMQISFNVTGPPGTVGYCNITIPKSLLSDSPWTININGQPPISFIPTSNDTHNFLYFTYTYAGTPQIIIQGTEVIPEFPTALILPLFVILSAIAIVFTKKRRLKKTQT